MEIQPHWPQIPTSVLAPYVFKAFSPSEIAGSRGASRVGALIAERVEGIEEDLGFTAHVTPTPRTRVPRARLGDAETRKIGCVILEKKRSNVMEQNGTNRGSSR